MTTPFYGDVRLESAKTAMAVACAHIDFEPYTEWIDGRGYFPTMRHCTQAALHGELFCLAHRPADYQAWRPITIGSGTAPRKDFG